MRGQAFVSFSSADVAKKALKEVKGFPLYSKPMVCIPLSYLLPFYAASDPSHLQQISFARTRSDAVVKRLDAEHYEEHRQRRIEHKSAYFTRVSRHALTLRIYPETTRYTNPLKQKFRAQRLAAESELNITFFFPGVIPCIHFRNRSRWPCSFCSQTNCRPDARRISASE